MIAVMAEEKQRSVLLTHRRPNPPTRFHFFVCGFLDYVVHVMKMGNIVPRAGIASMLTITPSRLPDVTTVATTTCLCGSLPESSVQTTTIAISKFTLG